MMIRRVGQTGSYLFVIVLTAFMMLDTLAQNVYPNKVIANGKLRWEDFSGQVDPQSTHAATTHWHIDYKYKVLSVRGDTVRIDLQVFTFLKGNSWVKPDQKTDRLLEHEQGHFNIALLCASHIKKEIASTVLLKRNYAEKINLIFQSLINEANLMSLQYDEETNHSLNRSAQKKWDQKLSSLLSDP